MSIIGHLLIFLSVYYWTPPHQIVLSVRLSPVDSPRSPVGQEGGAVEPDEVKLGEPPLVPDEGSVDVVDGAHLVTGEGWQVTVGR